MIFTAFSILGPVLVYPMPQNVSFTSEHFTTNILPLIKSEIEKLKGVSKTSKIRIHMDNARPHNEFGFYQDLKTWCVIKNLRT